MELHPLIEDKEISIDRAGYGIDARQGLTEIKTPYERMNNYTGKIQIIGQFPELAVLQSMSSSATRWTILATTMSYLIKRTTVVWQQHFSDHCHRKYCGG